jgi:ribosomal protein L13E
MGIPVDERRHTCRPENVVILKNLARAYQKVLG